MVFDHMFALIDSLSFSKKDENNTGIAHKKKPNKYPSIDTAFLVVITLLAIFIYGFSKIRKRYKHHYRKKYTGVELTEVRSTPLVPNLRQIY